MIIFGTRGVTSTKDRGSFYCPQCDGQQDYEHKRVRRFFTLYFIPLIPLDILGEYIECSGCDGTYNENVLSLDLQAEQGAAQAEFQLAMVRVMVHMMLADGEIDDAEMNTIRQIYTELSGAEIPEKQLAQEIERVQSSGLDVEDDLRALGPRLNDKGKELVVRAAGSVAVADGVLEDREKLLLKDIADAVQMTATHFRGILVEMAEEKERTG